MLISGTLLYLPLPNWEWMSAHQGVENNGWGQLGTLSAKHHGDLCLPEKTNMHIPLCGSQNLSNQCFCMGDNWINRQLCCQAFNGCEFESGIACTYRAHLDVSGGKSNSFPDKHGRHTNTKMWLGLSLSLCFSHVPVHARTVFDRPGLSMSLTHWLTYDSPSWTSMYIVFVIGDSCVVFLIGCFMFGRKPNMSNTFLFACWRSFDISKQKSNYSIREAYF